jgi:hypothetical protein
MGTAWLVYEQDTPTEFELPYAELLSIGMPRGHEVLLILPFRNLVQQVRLLSLLLDDAFQHSTTSERAESALKNSPFPLPSLFHEGPRIWISYGTY